MFRSKPKPLDSVAPDNSSDGSQGMPFQRRQAHHNLNRDLVLESSQQNKSSGIKKKITAFWGSTEKIKKDTLQFVIYFLNLIVLILTIYTYVQYGRKVPNEFKTPIGYTIGIGISYGLIGIATLYQMYQITRRIEPSPYTV